MIHQAGGIGPGSSCLVINLGREPLHITTIYFVLRTENHSFLLRLHEQLRISADERNWTGENSMKEGPLRAGGFVSLGDFSSMLESARGGRDGRSTEEDQELAEKTQEFEIRVTAMYSSFRRPMGASRRFAVTAEDDEVALHPKSPVTKQLTSFRQRRRVYGWLKESQEKDLSE